MVFWGGGGMPWAPSMVRICRLMAPMPFFLLPGEYWWQYSNPGGNRYTRDLHIRTSRLAKISHCPRPELQGQQDLLSPTCLDLPRLAQTCLDLPRLEGRQDFPSPAHGLDLPRLTQPCFDLPCPRDCLGFSLPAHLPRLA